MRKVEKNMKKTIMLAITFTLLLSTVAFASSFTGRVVSVEKGDTVIVANGTELVRVVFAGLACPELDQPVGPNAKQFTTDRLLGREVTVDVKGVGHDKQVVGVVTTTDLSIGMDLMRMGMAWYDSRLYTNNEMASIEKKMRSERVGLWAMSKPTPPWQHRRNNRGIAAVMSSEVINIGGSDYGCIQHGLGHGFLEAQWPPAGGIPNMCGGGPASCGAPGSSTPPGATYLPSSGPAGCAAPGSTTPPTVGPGTSSGPSATSPGTQGPIISQ